MQAYSEDYLFDAMEALGEAFDCAANRVNLGLDQFFEMFVATGVADAFGAGAPRYVSGSSGIELVLDVCYRAGLDIGVPLADMASDGEGPDYWCGWVLAYWQWETGRPFRTIGRVTTMEEIRASLRAIQQYEQRCKNINHGQGASLYRLAQTLGCRIEDLLEYPL